MQRLEAAKSDRSRCRHCKKKIAHGELRFGVDEQLAEKSHQVTHWFHLGCGAQSHPALLHEALETTTIPIPDAAALLERTANAPPPSPPVDLEGWWSAVREGDLEGVRTLLASAIDVNARTADRYTALHLAAMYVHPKLVQALVAQGADVRARGGIEEDAKQTPLHIAVSRRRPIPEAHACVTLLLDAGADPNARDAMGRAPIHLATTLETLQSLLGAGADPDAPPPHRRGWGTRLHHAALDGDIAAVDALLSAGANPALQTLVEQAAASGLGRPRIPAGSTALDIARASGHEAVARRIEQALPQSASTEIP
ncbi:ankyrin repeat domain-containing protein [Chondromyces crocatus]|uniref:PARP-type domain-containing protein n=1 Tax=Chondromyces crocatus TaxID=52 RepID=A0A0K1EPA7_CHOCO|nr:ankyrin repeat domain-containing protein [Chondromyces crocatus]AKT42681.1 uncharacterized protein CMC5_069080 [Chondromyces crocatus]